MRKLFLVAVTTCAIGSLAVPAASAARQPQPTLSVSDSCPPELPFDNFMLEVIVSGVGPGEEVTGSIQGPTATIPLGSFPADETGMWRVALFTGAGGLYTVSITSPFSATRSVILDCQPDPPPVPTRKDQCKNGGWQSYGVFKNQGDCVSFIATGGKNQPAGSKKP